ncbi:MAG: hypothetical protein ACRCSQ_10215, partial [Bacteroidales bacterium]
MKIIQDIRLKHNTATKIISISIILSIIIFAYHFSFSWNDKFYIEIRKTFGTILAVSGLLGSIFMYTHSQNDRSKKIFSLILFMLGTAATFTLINIFRNGQPIDKRVLSPFVILYGGTYGFLMAIYPIEVLRPKWLNFKKILVGFMPTLLLISAAYIYNSYWGEIRKFDSWNDFTSEAFSAKTLIRIGVCLYPVLLLFFMYHRKKEYKKWGENNYAVTENINIEWLDDYFTIYLIIIISYIYLINFYAPKSSPVHGSLFILFIFLFYNRIFNHESPYPQAYLRETEEAESEICQI